jgi:hypothetical protein
MTINLRKSPSELRNEFAKINDPDLNHRMRALGLQPPPPPSIEQLPNSVLQNISRYVSHNRKSPDVYVGKVTSSSKVIPHNISGALSLVKAEGRNMHTLANYIVSLNGKTMITRWETPSGEPIYGVLTGISKQQSPNGEILIFAKAAKHFWSSITQPQRNMVFENTKNKLLKTTYKALPKTRQNFRRIHSRSR